MSLTMKQWAKMIGQKVLKKQEIAEIEAVCKLNEPGLNATFSVEIRYLDGTYFCDMIRNELKPILRRIEDMTEEEERISREIYVSSNSVRDWNILVDYIDSIGVDQRGWIDAGLAIDVKTLED
jgi:hypothetical protein